MIYVLTADGPVPTRTGINDFAVLWLLRQKTPYSIFISFNSNLNFILIITIF